jgi:AcrR family transcriptional regulator
VISVTNATGRRERKKLQTRQSISDVATALFLERGFDAVTIAEVAGAADVAVQTVFNHFPTKEDLFFDDVRWVDGPARAVREAAAAPLADVLTACLRAELEGLRDARYLSGVVAFTRTLDASPALRARRAHLRERMEELLAEAIAGGPPDWRARLRAAQYAAAQRVLNAELVRRLDERADEPDAVLAAISADVAEALSPLRA